MSFHISNPIIDPGDPARPHVPLQLAIQWSGTFISSGGSSDPISQAAVDISLKGGTGPSGNSLGGTPPISSIMADSDGDGVPDEGFTSHCTVQLAYAKHIVPAKVVWEAVETRTDENGSTDTTTRGVLILSSATPTPERSFSPSAPTPDASFSKTVSFAEVYAPWLGKVQGDMNFQDEGNASVALV